MRPVPLVAAAAVAGCFVLLPSDATAQSELPGPNTPPERGVLGFYRYPALHGESLVFAAEGDLWTVPVEGGLARRLTTHHSEETAPTISPDGSTLAFTARYEGPAELYTMPLAGGLPVRRTFEAEPSEATTWTPDGRVVYTTIHFSGLPGQPQLVALDPETGERERVPLAGASEGTFDATGRTVYFVRPAFHDNVTKRYTGGTARKIWKYTAGDEEAVPLTEGYRGESHSPMWWEGRVYFVTDRDGTMNLWSMDEEGGDLRQHTRHAGWDVKSPDLHEGRVAYQLGADLWIHDLGTAESRLVPISLASDFEHLREKWVEDPMEYLTSAHLDPTGARVALTARGRVFVAPTGSGRLVRASRAPGVRYRDVVFLPDGDTLLGLSDETGELEFVTLPANGVGEPRRLTDDGTILRFTGHPSPDGRWIAYTDNNADLWVLERATGEGRRISENRDGIGDLAWSPDGRWLAYRMTAANTFSRIQLYDTAEGTTTPVTSDRVNSYAPRWDPKGEFLYFASDRNLESAVGSPWGPRAPEPFIARPMEIYHVALRQGLRSPFRPDDELHDRQNPATTGDDRGDGAHAAGASEPDDAAPPVLIDREGLPRRATRVPIPAADHRDLAVNAEAIFTLSRGSVAGEDFDLMAVEIGNDDPEPETLVEDVAGFQMSADGKKLLVRKDDALHVIDATPAAPADFAESRVDLSGWRFPIDVREDWRQIFVDAWRLERDYFYDPGMHGVDWEAMRDRYLPLVDRVTTRAELSELIGRFVGELSALHTSVRGGDLREGDDDVPVATLGARTERAPAEGGYRIEHIYRTDPDYPEEASPLADPYLDVEAGDVIEAVNGIRALDAPNLGALLRGQVGEQVLLSVRDARTGASRDLVVVPKGNELDLRYADWEYTRRLRVEERGAGSIGYIHLRAMGSSDVEDFYRQFYPVFDRQGLVLDVRNNRGGNIDSFVLDKLMRRAWMYWKGRVGRPTWNMQYAFRGHMVVLVDENTASDGEAVAEGFRRLGLGPVIGARTWGGEIWLSSVNRLSDGGLARAPMFGVYGPEGEWLIEQVGVIPDIVVRNLPHATFRGEDAQLDAAIDHLLSRIAEDPRPVPAPPPYPDRSFRYPVTQQDQGASEDGR